MFEFNGTASYSIKNQARCISALEGDTDHNTFLLASLVLRDDNELHVVNFNEDTNEVWCRRIYQHPHEVWGCITCPAPENMELLITTHANGTEQRTSLWRMTSLSERETAPEAGQQAAPIPMRMPELLQLGPPRKLGDSRGVLWNTVLPEQIACVNRSLVQLYQLSHGGVASSAAESGSASSPHGATFSCGRWDPHHAHALGLGCDRALMMLDTRTLKTAQWVNDAHEQRVRGMDFNPNKPNVLLSSGDDYRMCFWDLRKPGQPLRTERAHSHWVTTASYNRFHDQLVLSSGTDCLVKLWRAASISSAPPSLDLEEDVGEGEADGLVKLFEDHEQSVFGAVWSAADAWIFASLSLDGKAAINHVPPAEKYKILL